VPLDLARRSELSAPERASPNDATARHGPPVRGRPGYGILAPTNWASAPHVDTCGVNFPARTCEA